MIVVRGSIAQLATCLFCSFSALAAGISFVWLAPHLVSLHKQNLVDTTTATLLVSLVEVGCIVSPFPALAVCYKTGRKWILFSTGPVMTICWIIIFFLKDNIYTLYVIRIIQGLAIGIVVTVVPLYMAEITEDSHRCQFGALFMAMIFAGMFLVYCFGAYFSFDVFCYVCVTPSLLFTATFWYFPESPQWLVKVGREDEAKDALVWLRHGFNDNALQYEYKEVTESAESELEWHQGLRDLFSSGSGFKSLFVVGTVASTQGLGGFSVINNYASFTMENSGSKFMSPDLCTVIVGLVNLILAILVMLLIRRLRRRLTVIGAMSGSAVGSGLMTGYFILTEYTKIDTSFLNWVPYVDVMLLAGFMNLGLFMLLPTLQRELYPPNGRFIGAGITSLIVSTASFFSLNTYLHISKLYGFSINYGFFTMILFVSLILVSIFLPETKDKSYDEIEEALS